MSGFMLPIQHSDRHRFTLFIALDDETLGRVTAHDPFDARLAAVRAIEPWRSMELAEIVIGYVNAADLLEIEAMQKREAGAKEVVEYLSRGFAFRPELGDGGRVRQLGSDKAN